MIRLADTGQGKTALGVKQVQSFNVIFTLVNYFKYLEQLDKMEMESAGCQELILENLQTVVVGLKRKKVLRRKSI